MSYPVLPESVWWALCAASAAFFLAWFVPLMPNRRYCIQVSLVPVITAVTLWAGSRVDGDGLSHLLPMYATVLFAFPLGSIGRRSELRLLTRRIAKHGNTPDTQLSTGALAQLVIVATSLACMLAVYLTAIP